MFERLNKKKNENGSQSQKEKEIESQSKIKKQNPNQTQKNQLAYSLVDTFLKKFQGFWFVSTGKSGKLCLHLINSYG